eukprot:gnl/TRDRNA2_/TRDRNA2_189828_c0_seq1.p1 gnl/TRDRNA2_/TRDRNA2_189828_c0~~gnl/TRDRNA2_/TRDRNA2_189828_c0_seq1.p1  ORF type:complete len:607 (-),score=229.89 gnl/TRDRNA2_/TRDRNA2_189828_c0_seq1:200-2020(-)
MKVSFLFTLAGAAHFMLAHAASFGPGSCVSLTKSSAGSCVLTTNCANQDISRFEFAFDCTSQHGSAIQQHSFGVGGFDTEEEFDTEVKCDECLPPEQLEAPQPQAPKPAPRQDANSKHPPKKRKKPKKPVAPQAVEPARAFVAHKSMAEAAMEASRANGFPVAKLSAAERDEIRMEQKLQKDKEEERIKNSKKKQVYKMMKNTHPSKYGPDNCVETFKATDGHCIVKTDCKQEAIADYNFGLVCVDRTGVPVRHIFGKDSFDPKETFNTLIECDQCLGLETVPTKIAENGQLMVLSKNITEMADEMKQLEKDLHSIGTIVNKTNPAPQAAAPPAAAQLLVHQQTSRERQTHQQSGIVHEHKDLHEHKKAVHHKAAPKKKPVHKKVAHKKVMKKHHKSHKKPVAKKHLRHTSHHKRQLHQAAHKHHKKHHKRVVEEDEDADEDQDQDQEEEEEEVEVKHKRKHHEEDNDEEQDEEQDEDQEEEDADQDGEEAAQTEEESEDSQQKDSADKQEEQQADQQEEEQEEPQQQQQEDEEETPKKVAAKEPAKQEAAEDSDLDANGHYKMYSAEANAYDAGYEAAATVKAAADTGDEVEEEETDSQQDDSEE